MKEENITVAETGVIYSMTFETASGGATTGTSEEPVDQIQIQLLLNRFEVVMANDEKRREFEEDLIQNGIAVQQGSVSEAERIQDEVTGPPIEGEFVQQLIIPIFRNETEKDNFIDVFEQEIARIGNSMVVEDDGDIITIAHVADTNQTVIDQGNVEAETDVLYALGFERFSPDNGTTVPVNSEDVDRFLDAFEGIMATEEARREFERQLEAAGVMIRPRSLEPAVRVVAAQSPPTSTAKGWSMKSLFFQVHFLTLLIYGLH